MNNVQDIFTKNRRLAILRFLAEDQDYSLNTSVLQDLMSWFYTFTDRSEDHER